VLLFGLPAMALSAVIQFSIAYRFGLLTFWFLEIQGFVILSMALELLLGGADVPAAICFRAWAYSIAKCLPFYCQMYFPAAIFTGRLTDTTAILQGYAIQLAWLASPRVNQVLWTRGLRRTPPWAAEQAMAQYLDHLGRLRPLLDHAHTHVSRRFLHLVARRTVLDVGQLAHDLRHLRAHPLDCRLDQIPDGAPRRHARCSSNVS